MMPETIVMEAVLSLRAVVEAMLVGTREATTLVKALVMGTRRPTTLVKALVMGTRRPTTLVKALVMGTRRPATLVKALVMGTRRPATLVKALVMGTRRPATVAHAVPPATTTATPTLVAEGDGRDKREPDHGRGKHHGDRMALRHALVHLPSSSVQSHRRPGQGAGEEKNFFFF